MMRAFGNGGRGLARRLRVGLVWAGSVNAAGDVRSRSIDVFGALAGIAGVRFFSLQKGKDANQVRPGGLELVDFTAEWPDFAETAAFVKNLDLVITIDTSMAHLAGALAVPVWVLIPFQCDFRWIGYRTDSPWYPTMRLFREGKPGDVVTPVAEMARELSLLVNLDRRAEGA